MQAQKKKGQGGREEREEEEREGKNLASNLAARGREDTYLASPAHSITSYTSYYTYKT